jgi:multiple sugar transport system ATP-binding protein
MTMADRIVLMRQGVVEQIGTPLELYDAPVNTFAATFIGSPAMNLLSAELLPGETARLRLADGQSLDLPGGRIFETACSVQLGVRPEHCIVADAGLEATIAVVEPTGSETQLAVDLAGQRLLVIIKDRTELVRGNKIHIQPQWSRCHLFDSATGTRMNWAAPMLN